MAVGTRERMVAAAVSLFRERGFDATGFREVVARAGAARGVIYHHFPGGKVELGEAAAASAGGLMADMIEQICQEHEPREAVGRLLDLARTVLIDVGPVAGCPVGAVALAAEDPGGKLHAAADAVFQRWQHSLAGCLTRSGVDPERASDYAVLVCATVEGSVVLCRARGTGAPLAAARTALLTALPDQR